jgi:phospholipase D1/2
MAGIAAPEKHHSDHHGLGEKLKLPFRGLKDKLSHSEHLHDAKVHVIHQK